MNKLILTVFLFTMGFVMALGVTTDSAMASTDDMSSYNYSETKKDSHYGDSNGYEHGTMHEMLWDCFDYRHSGEYWHGYDYQNKYSYDDYNHTDNREYWHGYDYQNKYSYDDYNHTDNREYWHDKDSFGMPFMGDRMMPFMNGHDIMPLHMMPFDIPFMNGHDATGTITVVGVATTSVEPEKVIITMGVETTRPTAGAALIENSELLNAAVDSVVSLGVSLDDITTSRISIYPEYSGYYDDDGQYQQNFDGYTVLNTIVVDTTQIDMIATILDSAVQAGVNTVESIRFTISDDTKMMVHESLIESAVLNAKHQAYLALKPLQYTIIGVGDVVIDPSGSTSPLGRLSANLEGFASIATPIFTPDEDLSTTAVVTFLTSPDYSKCKK